MVCILIKVETGDLELHLEYPRDRFEQTVRVGINVESQHSLVGFAIEFNIVDHRIGVEQETDRVGLIKGELRFERCGCCCLQSLFYGCLTDAVEDDSLRALIEDNQCVGRDAPGDVEGVDNVAVVVGVMILKQDLTRVISFDGLEALAYLLTGEGLIFDIFDETGVQGHGCQTTDCDNNFLHFSIRYLNSAAL